MNRVLRRHWRRRGGPVILDSLELDSKIPCPDLLLRGLYVPKLEQFAQQDANNNEARAVMALAGHYLGDVLRHTNPNRALEVYDHSFARIREVPNDVAARRAETLLLAGSSYAARWIIVRKTRRTESTPLFGS